MLSMQPSRLIREEQNVEYTDGTLIQEDGTGLMFVVIDGKLSLIENSEIFDASNATTIGTAKLALLRREIGPAISGDAYLAIVDGAGYLVNNGEKRYLRSEEAIRKYNFNRGKFQDRSAADLPASAGADLG
jgi:hypothetical protein